MSSSYPAAAARDESLFAIIQTKDRREGEVAIFPPRRPEVYRTAAGRKVVWLCWLSWFDSAVF